MTDLIALAVWLVGLVFAGRRLARMIYFEQRSSPSGKRGWDAFWMAATLGLLAGAFWALWVVPMLIYKSSHGDPDELASRAFGDLDHNSKLKLLEARSDRLSQELDSYGLVELAPGTKRR